MRVVEILEDACRGHKSPLNAMSVDVEEHFHAAALANAYPRAGWAGLESRVTASTESVITQFDRWGAKGTFFTLGCVAERYPRLVRKIVDAGHEIASHGYDHIRVTDQMPQAFAADVTRTRKVLEDIGGQAVLGYRAANFSINDRTEWAFEALADAGYRYSSSINPIRHDHYGSPDAPRQPFRPGPGPVVEIPITAVPWLGRRWPAGGGGYFRLLPYGLWRRAVRRVNCAEARPVNFYFHPWEIDPGQPRAKVGAVARFRHYVNLDTMQSKLDRLLAEFRWGRMDQVYAEALAGGALARSAA
ncbi:XrtA system polysaccharide deacetylase [Lichenifustis flavocetrariae]|uniref:Chitooligosaccharide deacetylase n=1 Tax=Lichenifustis flavocetrariae TaxID=2949735 RepID=A0AA42CMA1_9HYPH|nr:XrtA system polysaccharide deacetylase [Lichenifustis flavocetrariae]MCW6511341.1 DUF3473 domain-containing protein [Lichenifustis flavocetrariae]